MVRLKKTLYSSQHLSICITLARWWNAWILMAWSLGDTMNVNLEPRTLESGTFTTNWCDVEEKFDWFGHPPISGTSFEQAAKNQNFAWQLFIFFFMNCILLPWTVHVGKVVAPRRSSAGSIFFWRCKHKQKVQKKGRKNRGDLPITANIPVCTKHALVPLQSFVRYLRGWQSRGTHSNT